VIYACYSKIEDVWFGAAIQDNQFVASCFSIDEPNLETLLKKLPADTGFHVTDVPNQNLTDALKRLHEVFTGKESPTQDFEVNINHLSSYAQTVLNCTRLIPVGYVTTYGNLSKIAGGIARSVGRVQATNPVPLLIPCHRVVKSDLKIGGYGYGKQTKWEILQRENRGYEESKTIKVGSKDLVVFPVSWVKQG